MCARTIWCLRRHGVLTSFGLMTIFVGVQYVLLMYILDDQHLQNAWKMKLQTVNEDFLHQAVEIIKAREKEMTSPVILDDAESEKQYFNTSRGVYNPLEKKFILYNKNLCKNNSVDIIILVPSVPSHSSLRNSSRFTFASMSRDRMSHINNYNIKKVVRVVYLVGRSSNFTDSANVKYESNTYKDIVEMDFVDSYYNLTLKMLHGLKWVSLFCPNASFVVKADEDVFINTIELIRQLLRFESEDSSFVLGTIQGRTRNIKVLREGKWGVSYQEMPLNQYPAYAQGNCYVISGKLVSKIVETAPYLPYLPIEDAFITGVVASKIHGAELFHLKRNAKWMWDSVVPDPCRFVRYRYISMSNMTPKTMQKIFDLMLNKNRTECEDFRIRNH